MMTNSENIFKLEKDAMTGDRNAVLLIISVFRKFRQAVDRMLESRYDNDESDEIILFKFFKSYEDILDMANDNHTGKKPPDDDCFQPLRNLTHEDRDAIYDCAMKRSDEILKGLDYSGDDNEEC